MKGQEHILRELFRLRPALQEMVGQPEHHRLMLPDKRGEGAFAARARPVEKLVPGRREGLRRGEGRQHLCLIREWTGKGCSV